MMKVWVMTTTLLEFGAADEETKTEEVSDEVSRREMRHFSRSVRSHGRRAPFIGALDGAEFFVIEGSCTMNFSEF